MARVVVAASAERPDNTAVLARRTAGCCPIAMSITMSITMGITLGITLGYMLIMRP